MPPPFSAHSRPKAACPQISRNRARHRNGLAQRHLAKNQCKLCKEKNRIFGLKPPQSTVFRQKPACKTTRSAFQDRPFGNAKRPVSHCKTTRFASQDGKNRKLARSQRTHDFYFDENRNVKIQRPHHAFPHQAPAHGVAQRHAGIRPKPRHTQAKTPRQRPNTAFLS